MPNKEITPASVAAIIDHAVLKPEKTADDIRANAALCLERGIGNLCVRPTDAALAASLLQGSATTLAVVVGFPHGANRTETKALEAQLAIEDGATELDMVMNIGQFLSGNYDYVRDDIAAVVAVAKPANVAVKVIFEIALLTPEQITRACELAIAAGADFVKTSTGFSGSGATPDAVTSMLKTCNGRAKVKASGGIRTWQQATGFVAQGAHRLGVSDAPAILDNRISGSDY